MSDNKKRYGWEQDSNIKVELTDASQLYCFKISVGNNFMLLHARSLCDLLHKAQIALLDWNAETVQKLLGL